MQRILKYHLLLDKLVEETPMEWTEDRRQLIKAREAMLDVAQCINDVKRDSDSLDVIRQIQASIAEWDNPGDLRLEDFGRLLKDDELRVRFDWVKEKKQYSSISICCVSRSDLTTINESRTDGLSCSNRRYWYAKLAEATSIATEIYCDWMTTD